MHKLPAVKAFARANGLNRIVMRGGDRATFGIVAAGKAYLDVRQALDDLGIDEARAARLGIRLMKIGMVWPLEPESIRDFAKGLTTIMVVEEKRSLIEAQLRDILYAEENRPTVIGKQDEQGRTLFAPHGVLEPNQIALAIRRPHPGRGIGRLRGIASGFVRGPNQADLVARIPYFCAGCPHNSSTVLPEGARGYAGIGCHWLAQFVPGRKTEAQPRWAARGRTGWARRPSPSASTSSRTWGWHLQSLRTDGHPARGRVPNQHHLQDPVQRCRRHDGRAAQ